MAWALFVALFRQRAVTTRYLCPLPTSSFQKPPARSLGQTERHNMKIGRRTWLRWHREDTGSTICYRVVLQRNKKRDH